VAMTRGAVLVTGVGGLIGGAVAARLWSQGRRVVGMDRDVPAGLPFQVLTHELPDPQRWHEAIVRFGVDRIVHAGGISGPMLLRDAPARICDINLAGLAAVLETVRIHRLSRLVWFSSIMAYGSRDDLAPVSEDAPLNPTTVYGATKAAGEALIRGFHAEHGVDGVALRVASCYGPGRTTPCLIRTLVENGLAGVPTRVREVAGVTRQHVFIDDVAEAACAALDRPDLPRRAYNIGPGVAQTLGDIVEQVRTAVPAAVAEPDPDGLAWNTFGIGPLDIGAARRDLGFEPRTSLGDGAARTRRWVEAQG
jgi:nucleoside-diphosphate-sugar epimerase